MAGIYDRLSDPKVRANLAPYIGHVQATADALGVPADFVTATIVAESNGQANAIGDNGLAQGIYQVQTPWLKDYGMTKDVRKDPVAATTAIMPTFAKIVEKAGGDWALGRLMYMRGQNSAAVKAVQKGANPAQVLANDPIALTQYNQFKALQGAKGGAVRTPPPEAKPAAAPAAPIRPLPIPVAPAPPVVTTRGSSPPAPQGPGMYLRALGIDPTIWPGLGL